MNDTAIPAERTILVIGAPRSGTTWLGKLLDSSPRVLYRHEPDMLIRPPLVRVVPHAPGAQEQAEAATFLAAMVAGRFFKSAGKIPLFAKSYRPAPWRLAYRGMIYALHLAQRVIDPRRLQLLPVPDLIPERHAGGVTVVVKSISSLGRANLLAQAGPGIRILLLVRDPFGQIASMLRGITEGRFERDVVLYECLETVQAARHGLTRDAFSALSRVEQHAWYWALMNDKAIEDLRGNAGAMVVCYNDLARDPAGQTAGIFAFCGLPVEDQTAAFLRDSTQSSRPDSYYHVYKNSADSVSKWRHQLTAEQQERIEAIVSRSEAWRLYPGLRAAPDAQTAGIPA